MPKSELQEYKQRFIDIVEKKVERPATMLVMRDIAVAKKKEIQGEHAIAKIQGNFGEGNKRGGGGGGVGGS